MIMSKAKFATVAILLGSGAFGCWQSARSASPQGQTVQKPKSGTSSQLLAAKDGKPKTESAKESETMPTLDSKTVAAMLKAVKVDDKIRELYRQRHAAALKEVQMRWEEFHAGKGTLVFLLQASRNLLDAERELCVKRSELVGAFEAHWKRLDAIRKIYQKRYDDGYVSIQDLSLTKYQALDAQIQMERVKKGQNPRGEQRLPMPKSPD